MRTTLFQNIHLRNCKLQNVKYYLYKIQRKFELIGEKNEKLVNIKLEFRHLISQFQLIIYICTLIQSNAFYFTNKYNIWYNL